MHNIRNSVYIIWMVPWLNFTFINTKSIVLEGRAIGFGKKQKLIYQKIMISSIKRIN